MGAGRLWRRSRSCWRPAARLSCMRRSTPRRSQMQTDRTFPGCRVTAEVERKLLAVCCAIVMQAAPDASVALEAATAAAAGAAAAAGGAVNGSSQVCPANDAMQRLLCWKAAPCSLVLLESLRCSYRYSNVRDFDKPGVSVAGTPGCMRGAVVGGCCAHFVTSNFTWNSRTLAGNDIHSLRFGATLPVRSCPRRPRCTNRCGPDVLTTDASSRISKIWD